MNSDDLCIINFNMEFKKGYIMISTNFKALSFYR